MFRLPRVLVVLETKIPSHNLVMKLDLPTAASPAKTILNVRSAGPDGSKLDCRPTTELLESRSADSSYWGNIPVDFYAFINF